MSVLGAPPASSTEVPPGGEPSSDIPLWVIGVAVVVVLALGGALAFVVLSQRGSSPDHPAAPTGRTYPAHWDKRIAPYAKIAADERGLKFLHPVAVRFLSPAKFKKGVTTDAKKLSKGDRADLRNATGLMRAFGLITGKVDLFRASNDVSGNSTLAYYSFADKRITIRGHRLTPSVRATLVHELTHVLQDQHFHVGAHLKKLEQQSKHGPSTTAWSVLDSIVEGDAQRVEHLYAASLPAKQRQALVAGQNHEATQANQQMTQVPQVLITMMSSPYTLGEGLVQAVAADGGNGAVNKLFRHPPTHESSLLDPFRVLAGQTGAAKVALPKLRPGEKKFDSGELGVLTWYFMLAERLPLTQALAAADGWNGDAYVAYVQGGSSCARMAYTGRTPLDTTRMYTALQGWVAAAPGSPASVSRAGNVVRFQSCDPGTSARVGKDDSQEANGLLTTREALGIGIMRGGATAAASRCIAGRLVQTFSVAELNDPNFQTDYPNAVTQLQQIGASCR
jgi:hypothetical protein